MSGSVTEEQAIGLAQHLDLIYSQAGTLYTIIPHAPRSSNENNRLAPPHADGMVGSISSTTATHLMGQLGQLALLDNPTQAAPATTTTNASTPSSEVNSVQTANSSQPSGNEKKNNNHNKKKNNNRNKKKNTSTEQSEQTNSASLAGGNKGRHKFKYPCMVFQEDHKTQDCPRLSDVQNYVKHGQPSSQLAVLSRSVFTSFWTHHAY